MYIQVLSKSVSHAVLEVGVAETVRFYQMMDRFCDRFKCYKLATLNAVQS